MSGRLDENVFGLDVRPCVGQQADRQERLRILQNAVVRTHSFLRHVRLTSVQRLSTSAWLRGWAGGGDDIGAITRGCSRSQAGGRLLVQLDARAMTKQ